MAIDLNNVHNVGDNLREMCEKAVVRYKIGFVAVYWDVQFSFGPVEVAPGQVQIAPAYWFAATTPSPLLGHPPLSHASMIPVGLIHEQEGIDNVVMATFEKIREAKAKAMSITNGGGV